MMLSISYALPPEPPPTLMVKEDVEMHWGLIRIMRHNNSDDCPTLIAIFYGERLCDAALQHIQKIHPGVTYKKVKL